MNANQTVSQQRAQAELADMRRQLGKWLKVRAANDQNLSAYDVADRQQYEPLLAAKLTDLLQRLHPEARLPGDAPALAEMAVAATAPKELNAPAAQGILPLIPLIIAGAVVLVLTSSVSSLASEATKREEARQRYKCISEGRCTDYGFWLKWGAIAGGAYVLHKLGVFKEVKRLVGAGGSYARRRIGARR